MIAGVPACLLAADEPASLWQQTSAFQAELGLYRPFFVDDSVGWITEVHDVIRKTVDGGLTWATQRTNLTERSAEVTSVWFFDRNHGWAAGAIRQQPTLWETNDGGSTWTDRYIEPWAFEGSTGAMLDVRFIDAMHGWAVGYNGLKAIIKATYDGGQHWVTQYSGSEITGQFNLVRFWDSSHGWVTSFDAVMVTDDGGESWKLRYFNGESSPRDIDVTGPKEAWIAGGRGHLIHSDDNGISWSEVELGKDLEDSIFMSVKFANRNTGWALGLDGEIVLTRDGGKSWTREAAPIDLTKDDSELVTDGGVMSNSKLFIIVRPAYVFGTRTSSRIFLWVRPIK